MAGTLDGKVAVVTAGGAGIGAATAQRLAREGASVVIADPASVSGIAGDYGLSSYNAAKAGVINLTRSAALENARYNIRVNCVCPGAINTRAAELLGREHADEFRRRQSAAHPLGRMGEAEEIANAMLFLASAQSSFITGAELVVDGGLLAHTGLPPFRTAPERP